MPCLVGITERDNDGHSTERLTDDKSGTLISLKKYVYEYHNK
jgi:hypothetical protein